MKRRRRTRRIRLGSSSEKHRGSATGLVLEALRLLERAKKAPTCEVTLERFGEAQRHLGGAIGHLNGMEVVPESLKRATAKADEEAYQVRKMIAGRCFTR